MASAHGRKIAVVTGGTAGVGRATVREFAGAGYDVAILARGQAGLDGAAKDVENLGGRALPIQVDVADHEAVQAAADQVERELGEIDVWVNVAFVGSLALFWDTTPEEYKRFTDVTYHGQVWGPGPRCPTCARATAASSSTSVPRWPTARSRCSRPTAGRSTR